MSNRRIICCKAFNVTYLYNVASSTNWTKEVAFRRLQTLTFYKVNCIALKDFSMQKLNQRTFS